MTEQEKLALLEATIEAEPGSLKPEMDLEGIDEYDSLAKLSLIVMMEDDFGRKLTANDVRSFKTVGDILKCMEK